MTSAASVLNRDGAALVVIDIQARLAAAMARREQVIARTKLLLRVASIVGLPVLVTRQYPKGLGDTEPEIVEVLSEIEQAGSTVIHTDKMTFDCFSDPAFSDAAARLDRRQLLLVGMESHICVTQSALAGLDRGFDVHIAADACCSRSDEHHELAVLRLAHAGAVISSSESAAYELVGCAGTDEFKSLLNVVKG